MPGLPSPALEELLWLLRQARAPRLRSMRQFAEEEIILPDGPFEGRRFKGERMPAAGLWFDQIDSQNWVRHVLTAPSQSGKSLCGFVIPTLYHLFEVGETVIMGLPDMDMAADKWRQDLLPVIERTRYRDLLPRKGGGSRGGKVRAIQFRNGRTLRFMSGGGSDKSRAAFTSRVLVITETDGMDEAGSGSREADKITQLEARTRAFGNRKRVYMECTLSVERGRTWQEIKAGSDSKIVLHCPHCHGWVSPEREHLIGWKEATSLLAARDAAAFHCPGCGARWSETDRLVANADGRLLHKGQNIDADGAVSGANPPTDTLGFRWSAVHNLLVKSEDVAADEWKASRSTDEENAEKELRQFVWALPWEPPGLDSSSIDATALMQRQNPLAKGVLPLDTEQLTLGIDCGKWLCHWVLVAWRGGAAGHIADYGVIEVASGQLGVEKALLAALNDFSSTIAAGWPMGGERRVPDQVWIDAGYQIESVKAFCRGMLIGGKERFRPVLGRGATQQYGGLYHRPPRTGSMVRYIGEGYHIVKLARERIHLVEIDVDHWKSWLHARLSCPPGSAGAASLYQAKPTEHLSLTKHLTAERRISEYVAGTGDVVRWERVRAANHYLDACNYAAAAAHFCGARLIEEGRAGRGSGVGEQQRSWFGERKRHGDGEVGR